MYRFRVALEGVAVVVRCLTTCALTVYGASLVADASTTSPVVNPYSVLAFAVAQLLYALTIAVGYLMFFYALSLPGRTQPITGTRQLWARRAVQLADISSEELDHLPALADLIPQPIDRTSNDFVGRYVPEPLRNLALVYTRQSLVKHLLTEGDKVAVTWLCSDTDQGVHAFVSNYGSLLARILFLPIEETSRTLFSRLLGSRTAELAVTADPADVKTRSADRAAALSYLTGVLRLYALLGLIFIAFGTNYTGLLIDALVGSRWSLSAAPQTLAVYCLYVPILAVNGVTEAFVQSVATETQLARLSTVMGITSSIFVISVTLFVGWLKWGAVGVVLANIISMGCRITYNFRFIRRFQPAGSPRFAWLPSKPTMTAGVIAWALTFASGRYIGWTTWSAKGLHIAVGGLGLGLVAVALLRFDQATARAALGLLRKRKAD
ncbi:Oligosaccharide translocation protein rft1 [Tieghemiomyces parasiticus]|uniref:Man(5)GlcNAc(2)-PP-dolichol translocation protein RFT1 n=1 Tax=Tieghemiomyces parasiticus TaxID=78921 RepID=A0A9W7ZU82_9FUNG|nr:Oligosaccharide translocation protein rft1 [Tieghemiomyces parasiticus]